MTQWNVLSLEKGRARMTYLQRIDQLDKKIYRAKKRLDEIEEIKGQNKAYRNKQMEIEELEHLKSWYNKKIIDEYEEKKSRYCRMAGCKWYLHGRCFLKVEPINNNCEHMETE